VGTFGEKLRKQREQRGLALDAISNTTKISTRMLRALEEEHFDQLPGGVFNKGFVRAYARQVGLDEEETISDYLAALRESQVQSQQILPDFRTPGGKPQAVTPHDSRHHILPASDHPGSEGQNNGSHDLDTEERRRQERRNEIRRSQDRGGNEKKHRSEVPSEVQRHDAHVAEGRRKEEQRREPDVLPGFITLGPAGETSTQATDVTARRVSRIAWAVAFLLVTAVLAFWNTRRHRQPAPAASSDSAASSLAAQAPPPTVPAAPSAAASSPRIEATSTVAKPAERKSSASAPVPSSRTSLTATTLAPKPSANPSPANPVVASTVTHLPVEKPPATFTVLIRAEQTTWVSITADGKPVIHETLIAPAHTSVRAAHDVSVRVGNAAGVSFLVNGKEFPAQGNAGEVRTYFFDASGLQPAPQTPDQAPVR
jgi:Helix-turn-helix domain/Domain of unknown function (DUF4115)